MNTQLSVETAVCTEHERLHIECEKALEIWNEHRAEFCQFRFIEREAGDELLRLQAKSQLLTLPTGVKNGRT